jgi:signal transduction histidine kinase
VTLDLTTKLIDINTSEASLGDRLKKSARLLARYFKVDDCTIYRWTDRERLFMATAHYGKKTDLIENYRDDEGLAWIVAKTQRPVSIYTPSPDSIKARNVEDRGLRGFRSTLIHPLTDGRSCFGVIYLKSRTKKTLSAPAKKQLATASKLITYTIKSNINYMRLRSAYNEYHTVQKRLVNAEKLMTLGELSATLAHEIKNPLLSIGGYAKGLRRNTAKNSKNAPYIDQICSQVKRLEAIIDDIFNYTEERPLHLCHEDINEVLRHAMLLFKDKCKSSKIRISTKLSKTPLSTRVDTDQIKIAFDNLIANAIQSMEGGGVLTLTTSKEKDWVVIEIADSGGGVDPKHLGEIFDPFFTTKKSGKCTEVSGTGLGLPITNRIVTRHQGIIDIKNSYGEGITFAIRLPSSKGNNET